MILFTFLYAWYEFCGYDLLDRIPLSQTPYSWKALLGALPSLFFFSFATMVTLGFGNVNALIDPPSKIGMLLVCLNLFSGYFLLATLVTRIGILFGSLGPEQEIKKSPK